ncbi:DUF5707 domain-containing protein [Streptomyces nigrescens]
MHKRTTMAAVASALALSAFAVPGAAQADEVVGDTTMKVVVNGGSDIVLGTTKTKTFTMTVTATDDSGIKEDYNVPSLWHGPGQKMPDDPHGFVVPDNGTGDCVAHSATTTTCTFTLTMNPRIDTQDNTTAGIWKVVTCPAGAGSRPRHVTARSGRGAIPAPAGMVSGSPSRSSARQLLPAPGPPTRTGTDSRRSRPTPTDAAVPQRGESGALPSLKRFMES